MTIDVGRLFGRGMSFPPRIGPNGRFAVSEGPENVRESIRVILLTEQEERLMLPEFGGGLKRFLFEPNVPSTHRLIQDTIEQALGRWEPRIHLESVDVRADEQDDEAAIAAIRYRLVATQESAQMHLRIRLAS